MQAKNPTKSASTGIPSQATLTRHIRSAPSRFICSLVCLLIFITHVDRTYGGVITTLRFEVSTPSDMYIRETFGVGDFRPWQGTWEREIEFDTADYDSSVGVAYADLKRVEDSYTSTTHAQLNYVDRAQDLTANPSGSHLYLGLIDFSTLQSTYQSFRQAGIPLAPPNTKLEFTFAYFPDPQPPFEVEYESKVIYDVNSDIRIEATHHIRDGGFTYDGNESTGVHTLDAWSIKMAQAQAVPEPSTAIAMGLLGIVGFAGNRRRRLVPAA